MRPVPAYVLAADVMAQAADGVPELPAWANYGLLGLVIIAIVSGRFIVLRRELDRERELLVACRAELAQERADNTALRKDAAERVLPALVRATEVLARNLERRASSDGG